jgi:HK97 gp10 family phage protein
VSDVTVKWIGLPELERKLHQLAEGVAGEALANALMAGASCIESAAKEGAPRKAGNLARSIHKEVTEKRDDYAEVAIGTDVIYAAIQEFGGTVTPKNAKNLAIPLTEEARSHAGGPRTFGSELTFAKTAGGTKLLLDAAGEAQYVLKSSVTIPAHPYLRPALDEKGDQAAEDTGRALGIILENIANAGN